MLFFYVRHGDPIYNPDSLTPLGHEQARALGDRWYTQPAIPQSFGEGMARVDREVDAFFLSLGYAWYSDAY